MFLFECCGPLNKEKNNVDAILFLFWMNLIFVFIFVKIQFCIILAEVFRVGNITGVPHKNCRPADYLVELHL